MPTWIPRGLRSRYSELRWRTGKRFATPPPRVKQKLVARYGRRFSCRTLVETGTARGDMLAANRHRFERLFSIELDPHLVASARRRFGNHSNVEILEGDSAEVLAGLLPQITEPCLFWLDAHAMVGGVRGPAATPILSELEAIFDDPLREYVLLVDDARLFSQPSGYPSLEEVRERCLAQHPGWQLEVRDDVIRFHPPADKPRA